MTQEKEITTPFEIDPEWKTFHFMGFVRDENTKQLCADFFLLGRWSSKQWIVFRTTTKNPYSYKIANWAKTNNDEPGKPVMVNPIKYDETLYNSQKEGPLWGKYLTLKQIVSFVSSVDELVNRKGLDNLNEDIIFSSPEVRKDRKSVV